MLSLSGQPDSGTPCSTTERPRAGSPRLVDVICIGGFLLSLVYPLALIPLEPALLASHPILVAAFLGTTESLVAAGAFARVGRVALWLAIAAPLPGNDLFDPFSWWVGRRYGKQVLTRIKGGERYHAAALRAEASFRRWGPWAVALAYYLPIPNVLIYLAAGESGMSLVQFVVLDLLGTALGIIPLILLGFVIGQSAVHVAELITHYAGISTVVLVVLIVAFQIWRSRLARR